MSDFLQAASDYLRDAKQALVMLENPVSLVDQLPADPTPPLLVKVSGEVGPAVGDANLAMHDLAIPVALANPTLQVQASKCPLPAKICNAVLSTSEADQSQSSGRHQYREVGELSGVTLGMGSLGGGQEGCAQPYGAPGDVDSADGGIC